MPKLPADRPLRRLLLLLVVASYACTGCGGDDSVRGSGSIDIPRAARKSYVPEKFQTPKYQEQAETPAAPR